MLEPDPRESLSNALNNSLATIHPYELLEEVKPEFEEWWGLVTKVESIQATIDKMSNDEVADCAYKILELYIRIEKHSGNMSSPNSDKIEPEFSLAAV